MEGDGVGAARGSGTRGKEAGMAEDGLSDLIRVDPLSEAGLQSHPAGHGPVGDRGKNGVRP